MGTLGSWQSAATTFLFAEAALDPFLLEQFQLGPSSPSPDFQKLCQALAVVGPPDIGPDGPVATYQTSITSKGILGANTLTYLGPDRSLAHQSALATWCGALSASKPDLALEIFWAVPMLVGERLHASGQYQAALDWLWVAFPYNTSGPVSSYNLINTELATPTASAVPAELTFGPDWTADLNPFQLVRSGSSPYPYRPYTWIRSTLLAIISCLADYADSEFSMSTGESLGHARNLYGTAAGLLAHPSLTPIKPSNPGEPARQAAARPRHRRLASYPGHHEREPDQPADPVPLQGPADPRPAVDCAGSDDRVGIPFRPGEVRRQNPAGQRCAERCQRCETAAHHAKRPGSGSHGRHYGGAGAEDQGHHDVQPVPGRDQRPA
jgi:hypothetical protein